MTAFITPTEAAALVQDHMTVVIGGFGFLASPDELLAQTALRYEQTGHPANITVVTGISTGDMREGCRGLSMIKAKGLIGTIITSHLGNAPDIARMVAENQIAGYSLPLGVVSHLLRAIGGKKPGVLTPIGLGTYADPRNEGCKANELARQQHRDIVIVINIEGEEYLLYKSFPIDMCLIRGTYADLDGNISLTHEAITESQLEMAIATHNCGGKVIVQVEKIVERNVIPPREVHIPRQLVDYVTTAPPENHMQIYAAKDYRPELAGEIRSPVNSIPSMPLNVRKVIARRCAMEFEPNSLINLGIGIPSGVGSIANEEGISDFATLSLESGIIGGVPLEGMGFGAAVNPECIMNMSTNFDLYDGGGLDMTFLGAAEIDEQGDVNVSLFGTRCTGPGGFINITQTTPKVFFMSTFAAGHGEILVEEGRLRIVKDAPHTKFVKKVRQITFSADYARKTGQQVTYVTERAVFRLVPEGLMLLEYAPGVSVERDILAHMDFRPLISPNLKQMDERLFQTGKMGIASEHQKRENQS